MSGYPQRCLHYRHYCVTLLQIAYLHHPFHQTLLLVSPRLLALVVFLRLVNDGLEPLGDSRSMKFEILRKKSII